MNDLHPRRIRRSGGNRHFADWKNDRGGERYQRASLELRATAKFAPDRRLARHEHCLAFTHGEASRFRRSRSNVYLWDAQNWKLLRKITGQPEMISSLAFSPDGRLLVTGGFSDISSKEPVSILLRDLVPAGDSHHRFGPPGFRDRLLARWQIHRDHAREKAVHLWRVPDAK